MAGFELRYSHNIIEHLGLKLYQNRPSNVLAELVSNSWDADASHVWLDVSDKFISVADDGDGMARDVLAGEYLIIGRKKATRKSPSTRTTKGRLFMGRKGIGKLAPFGIAKRLSVVTISAATNRCSWIVIELPALLQDGAEDSDKPLEYFPTVICDDVPVDGIPANLDATGSVEKFLSRAEGVPKGTILILEELSIHRNISSEQIKSSLAQRFSVITGEHDFAVSVGGDEVTITAALPHFEFRSPVEGFAKETISVAGIDREVRYWVGFVKHAEWPQDQTGVGIYAHGKIAQDRPFVFGLKGKEISTRYMFGVIEADWMDELPDDVISTDRTSISWDHPLTEPFYEWGQSLVSRWINDFRAWQALQVRDIVTDKFRSLPDIPKVTPVEQEMLRDMVLDLGPRVHRDVKLQDEVIRGMTSAWIHRPSRAVINQLWAKLKEFESDDDMFVATLGQIYDHLVPESLSLSVAVAQKIFALSRLFQLSINGSEGQLQKLLEAFPWILGTDKGKLRPNRTLKTLAREAVLNGSLSSHGQANAELLRHAEEGLRPDFAIFDVDGESYILVVEIKSPLIPLTRQHQMQLDAYKYWIEDLYPNADVRGLLIGKDTGLGAKNRDSDTDIKSWTTLVAESRKDYLELLTAMLNGIPENLVDSRVDDILSFGGDEARELLSRMAGANPNLRHLFDTINSRIDT